MNTADKREWLRDKKYIDKLHKQMVDDHRRYELSAAAYASALRGYEHRYGSDR